VGDAASGGALMELRNRGGPSGFSKFAAPMMTAAMRRANGEDLMRSRESWRPRLSVESQEDLNADPRDAGLR
jgi:hypothetical protein